MTKEEMTEKVLAIKNPKNEKAVIFKIGKELGLNFKPTSCQKCLKDYIAIIKETLGLIESAAEESGFDEKTEWVYLLNRPQSWHGHIIDQYTDPKVIEQFVKDHPVGYYKMKEKTEPQQEEQ